VADGTPTASPRQEGYLVGSDYVYPETANSDQIKEQMKSSWSPQDYIPLGKHGGCPIIAKESRKSSRGGIIINHLRNGDSNVALSFNVSISRLRALIH